MSENHNDNLSSNILHSESDEVIVEIKASKSVNCSELIRFIHEEVIISNISQFINHGVKKVSVIFFPSEGKEKYFNSSPGRPWVSIENIRKDIEDQIYL